MNVNTKEQQTLKINAIYKDRIVHNLLIKETN